MLRAKCLPPEPAVLQTGVGLPPGRAPGLQNAQGRVNADSKRSR
jgi:hypothetical protein